jgi:hypothetical protein
MGKLRGDQIALWSHEDLPLWTGTAPSVQAGEYTPTDQGAGAEHSGEQTTWAECPVCLDTGRVSAGWCECPVGQRVAVQNAGRGQ